MTQRMIDLEDYVSLEQANSLNKMGYPKEEADYYWFWRQPSIFEDAIWILTPKEQVLKATGGDLWRCIAAPLKIDAVAWKLANAPKAVQTFAGVIYAPFIPVQQITITINADNEK